MYRLILADAGTPLIANNDGRVTGRAIQIMVLRVAAGGVPFACDTAVEPRWRSKYATSVVCNGAASAEDKCGQLILADARTTRRFPDRLTKRCRSVG